MKRTGVLVAAVALCYLMTGCSQPASAPVHTMVAAPGLNKPTKAANSSGGVAPTAVTAPPGVQTGDHRGGLAGGTIPGMTNRGGAHSGGM